ncbi:MAG: OmpH family outer membrane protein, partial [Sandaracinaceae bacterium]|nr:OmpH family outer membrane protein [Sandaracinaceae bacterium]
MSNAIVADVLPAPKSPTGPSWFQRHAISLVAAIMLASMAPKALAQVRIAVVDLQRALQETEDGRRAKARLKRLFKQRQEDLDKRQNELKQLSEELEQQSKVLSSDARQERVEDLQKKALELQQLYVQYQRELAEKEAELTSQIIGRMEQILRRIGQTEGYTLIVERSEGGVVWVPSNLDLTDVVIQRYNSGEGREGGGGGATGGGGGSGG